MSCYRTDPRTTDRAVPAVYPPAAGYIPLSFYDTSPALSRRRRPLKLGCAAPLCGAAATSPTSPPLLFLGASAFLSVCQVAVWFSVLLPPARATISSPPCTPVLACGVLAILSAPHQIAALFGAPLESEVPPIISLACDSFVPLLQTYKTVRFPRKL